MKEKINDIAEALTLAVSLKTGTVSELKELVCHPSYYTLDNRMHYIYQEGRTVFKSVSYTHLADLYWHRSPIW